MLKAIAKHSAQTASVLTHGECLQIIIVGLEDFDSCIKETAACTVGYIAKHDKDLADVVNLNGMTF